MNKWFKGLRNLVIAGILLCGGIFWLQSQQGEPDIPETLQEAIESELSTNLRDIFDNDIVVVSFDSRADVSFVEFQMQEMLCAARDFTDKGMRFSAFMPDGDERINGLTVEFSAEEVQAFPCDAGGQVELEPIADYDLNPRFR